LLGLILERSTGRSVCAYLEEKIWQRLGMEFPAAALTAGRLTSPNSARFSCTTASVDSWDEVALDIAAKVMTS
jgi:CubicO group peptidase (beta-lactamase class C family)